MNILTEPGATLLFSQTGSTRGIIIMATFDALERLQKFDWLIQKLHSLRSSLQTEQGMQELQKLHALQLLQKSEFQFNGSSVGESEEDKMDLCKNEDDDEDEDREEMEEEEEEEMEEELVYPTSAACSRGCRCGTDWVRGTLR